MVRYKKFNPTNKSLCVVEIKTLDGKIYKPAVIKDKKDRLFFCFLSGYTTIEIYSGGDTKGNFLETLDSTKYTFVRFLDLTDIESI